MLLHSQPIDPKTTKKIGFDPVEHKNRSKPKILSERMGTMFDDIIDRKRKIDIKTRLEWLIRDIKGVYHDTRYVIRNHIKWCKTINKLRPWEGFDGMLDVMITHLIDYVNNEEKYGHSEESYKERKVAAAKETVRILRRMKNPMEYSTKRRKEVDKSYPKYIQLITKYSDGSTGMSGRFVCQGDGWTGEESGKDPRKGYFEFVNGRFELATSPNKKETDRLLLELAKYDEEVTNAYTQAEVDSDRDFERLGELLKTFMYQWWD